MPSLPRSISLSLWIVGSLIVVGQYLQGLASFHIAVAPISAELAAGLDILILMGTAGILGVGWYWLRQRGQGQSSELPPTAVAPEQVTPTQVETSLQSTDQLIAQLQDQIQRQALSAQVQDIKTELKDEGFHLVIFGTSSAGKTSLINALLGQWVGETAATFGTTQTGSAYTYTIEGLSGSIQLTDTPGLNTISGVGEAEAKALAKAADLLIFVVSGDLLATEYEELLELAQLGKRAIIALNKIDQILPEDVTAILNRVQERVSHVIPTDHIVAIAADPQPLKVKHIYTDSSVEISFEDQAPDTAALVAQVASILIQDGHHLRLANALLKAQTLAATAHEIRQQEREYKAQQLVEHMQWATAAAVAVTPLPAVDLVAAVAINARMIGSLHDIFERQISLNHAKDVAQSLTKLIVKLGGVELATQALGSVLKASPLALVGLPLQAASAAYLTRIAGLSYIDWLKSNDPWDEVHLTVHVEEQFQQYQPQDFLVQFGQQAFKVLPHLLRSNTHSKATSQTPADTSDLELANRRSA